MSQRPAIGIDLGTTNSCVAIIRNGTYEVIRNGVDQITTPSYVAFTDTDILVGNVAKEQRSHNLENTVYDIKRLIGRRFEDESVRSDVKCWPFKVIDDNGKIKIEIKHEKIKKTFTPEELSAMVLIYLKRIAEDYLGVPVKDAVIAVPAYFNNSQREATKLAGQIAGLNVLTIVNEPTAAALAYVHKFKNKASNKVLVYDFGGGTFDVSILGVIGTKVKVLSSGGDTHLGGNDIDKNLAQYFIEIIKDKHNSDISNDRIAFARLLDKCEKVKNRLSFSKCMNLDLENISKDLNITEIISIETFENLNKILFQSTLIIVDACLKDAKLNKAEIDEIVLVGGSTRIPKIQKLVQCIFNNKKICKSVNGSETVAVGAAYLADNLQRSPQMSTLKLKIVKINLIHC